MVLPNPKTTYKAMLMDYDALLAMSDEECSYCLSEREIGMLLAFVDYIGWKTRYIATETEIDQDLIDEWSGNLARKLMSGCCGDDNKIFRYLPDGTLESSEDGGITWTPDPEADPRTHAPLAPPLPGVDSDSKRCAAADNVREQYVAMRDQCINLLTAGTTVLLIVAFLVGAVGAILSISVVGVTFGVILFSLAGALLSLTPEEVAEQIDDEALDAFRCIVYCHMDESGRVEIGGFDNILADIASQFSGFPETFFYSITASLTATGLNNAATLGAATSDDCGDCDCPSCVDPAFIIEGVFVDSGDNWIEIQSAFDAGYGQNMVVYGSYTVGEFCCYFAGIDLISGDGPSSFGYQDCDGNNHPSSPILTTALNGQFGFGTGTGVIRLTFS